MISVICACNNLELFKRMLLPSLQKQVSKDWEIVLIDTRKEKIKSASVALNQGAERAKGDILLFVHQDVELLDEFLFDELINFCNTHEFGVGGVAGIDQNSKTVYSSVVMNYDHRQAGEKLISPYEVDTLDECLFFIKKSSFKGFSDLGITWHFYAVDYSLQCKLAGEAVLVFPLEIYHLSPGWSLDSSYWKTLSVVAKKYKANFNYIPTTVGIYKNNFLLPLEIFARKIKRKICAKNYR